MHVRDEGWDMGEMMGEIKGGMKRQLSFFLGHSEKLMGGMADFWRNYTLFHYPKPLVSK